MIESVDIRLASMLSALTGAILPAVENYPFAREQAELLAGHLQVLRVQADYAEEFEQLEHCYTRQLGADIIADAVGGPLSTAAAERIRDAIAQPVPESIAALRVAHRALTTAIADFITAQGEDGSAASVEQSTKIIVQAEHGQSLRDRSFFSPFGYDVGSEDIQPIGPMMAEFRDQFAPKGAIA